MRCASAQQVENPNPGAIAPPVQVVESAEEAETDVAWTVQTPPTLRREVRRFTFEESEKRLLDMPLFFYRYIAADHGFPSFGKMGPRNDHAASGNWSFGFQLDGGSMAARVPTGIIPIVDSGRYVVTARVRTEGLAHSRAQLVLWLDDFEGKPIVETRTASKAADTKGAWTTLSVEVSAEDFAGTDLAIELRLVQPRDFVDDPTLAPPHAEDITGRAWFDDIVIWRAPNIELTTGRPGNIIPANGAPALQFDIRDVASEPLIASLRVYDVDGNIVHKQQFDRRFEVSERRTVALPALEAGWYRAVIDARSNEQLVGRKWLDFAILGAQERAGNDRSMHQFGVELTNESLRDLSDAPAILKAMNADEVVVPIWPATHGEASMVPTEMLVKVAEEALLANCDVVVALDEVPSALATQLGINRMQVLDVLAGDSSVWRPHLDGPILALGLEVRRWRLRATPENYKNEDQFRSVFNSARKRLSEFVPDPDLVFQRSALDEPLARSVSAYEITIPSALRPVDIAMAMSRWMEAAPKSVARLDSPGYIQQEPRQLVDDTARRALYTWRSGVRELTIDAPWRMNENNIDRAMPTPMLPVWRVLADQLSGRTFVGELDLPDVEACWIIEGASSQDAALVVWTGRNQNQGVSINMVLADGPVTVVDIFGNARAVAPGTGGRHNIELGETPIFINGIDARVAQFRAMFTVEPEAIPSVNRLHEVELVLRNPWDISINGHMRVRNSDQWQLNPRTHHFSIEPNGEVRLPIEMVFDRNVIGGRKTVDVEMTLRSDRVYELVMSAPFEIGVTELHVSAQWQMRRNPETGADDLIITQYISNRGDRPMTVSAFLHGPGLAPRVRPLGRIEPGASAVQQFYVDGGAQLLSGKAVRYGVKEMDGATRLNRVMNIPAFSTSSVANAPE